MKVYEITESRQQLDEAIPLLALAVPTITTAIRVGGPRAISWLAKKGASMSGRVAAGAAKRPITTALAATGVAGYNALKDLIPEIPEALKAFMGKYAIPAAAVLAAIYGGKKLYDYFKNKEKQKTQESINENLRNFISETTSAGMVATSMGSGNGFVNGGPGTISRYNKSKKKKRKSNG